MENPATWGKPEHVIHEAIHAHDQAAARMVIGLSLTRCIADALREAGLLRDDAGSGERSAKRATHVRYISPFGSPYARMLREQAEQLLVEDDRRWLDYQQTGLLTEQQRRAGPPRIEELPR